MEKEFPYSQVIRSLTARATQDNNLPEKEDQLHLAAMCATDRTVFKATMTAPVQTRLQDVIEFTQSTEIKDAAPKEIVEERIEPVAIESPARFENTEQNSETIYEDVIHDLEALHNSMHAFEETVKNLENGKLLPNPSVEVKKKRSADPDEKLLSELKTSKKKLDPEGSRQKEQHEIIEEFIKTQPSIKGRITNNTPASQDDLTEKIDGYNENIISETLAQILIKQGKKDKAIDILKKLIWKFPQKKAYFAAQIEDLKK